MEEAQLYLAKNWGTLLLIIIFVLAPMGYVALWMKDFLALSIRNLKSKKMGWWAVRVVFLPIFLVWWCSKLLWTILNFFLDIRFESDYPDQRKR